MGGEYITWFNEEGSKERSLLYKLENMDIVRLHIEREGKGVSKYEWKLTKKGQKIVDENKCLQNLWKDGKKINVIEFYKEIVKIMGIKL